ncbi:hypothetical protein, partial [Desulfobacter postgatei]|uniref:hypothetical protein n=1 Tax=Desulfobacter postgatei TaxID=2293 RepID=UPI002A361810
MKKNLIEEYPNRNLYSKGEFERGPPIGQVQFFLWISPQRHPVNPHIVKYNTDMTESFYSTGSIKKILTRLLVHPLELS